jgi:hypothetical protein
MNFAGSATPTTKHVTADDRHRQVWGNKLRTFAELA